MSPAQTPKNDDDDVFRDGLRQHEPVDAAVLRDEKDPFVHRVLGRVRAVALVAKPNLAAALTEVAEERAHEGRAAASGKADDAEDLARKGLE